MAPFFITGTYTKSKFYLAQSFYFAIILKNMTTILLLFFSNIFMTYAWYGHLKNENVPIWKAILISWGIAFFEYCLMVPANRIGYKTFSAFQLKTIQEAITLIVFSGFAVFVLKERLTWNYVVGFGFIFLAVFFVFKKW